MNLINVNDYFAESEKVIEIVKQKEDQLHRQLPTAERLRIAEEELKAAKSREEYEQLKKIKEDLELKIRLNELNEPAIPAEYQDKIRRNREIEEEQAVQKLNELKSELAAKLSILESELLPIVTNIVNLERRRDIGLQVDKALQSTIYEDPQILSVRRALRTYSLPGGGLSSDLAKASSARALLVRAAEQLKAIKAPIEARGFFKNRKKVAK